jgi:hypothetical protein
MLRVCNTRRATPRLPSIPQYFQNSPPAKASTGSIPCFLAAAITLWSVLGAIPPAYATNCSALPNTLTNGTTADATQVMANFTSLRDCANNNLAPIAGPAFSGSVYATTYRNLSSDAMLDYGGSNDINVGSGNPNQFVRFYSGGPERVRISTSGNVGIGTTSPSYLLHVNGTAYATGAAGALSDIRHKKHITVLKDGALNTVMKLRPVSFEWKEPKDDGMKGEQIGFIAQEVEKVLPSTVLTQNDANKTKGLKYNELIPVLTKALQELEIANQQLEQHNVELETRLTRVEALLQTK